MVMGMFRGKWFNIEGKKLFGFCGGRTRFFISTVGGGGS